MDKYGPEKVCQGNFVGQIEELIKNSIKDDGLQSDYQVGFIDGLIKAIQLIRQ